MKYMHVKILLPILVISLIASAGCSRELTSGESGADQPFELPRIPVGVPDQNVSAGQGDITGDLQISENLPEEETPELSELMDRGRMALLNNDYDLAIESFTNVIEIDPNHVRALYNLSLAYRRLENIDKAIEYGERAVEADPDTLYVHQNLANAYMDAGDIDSAIGEFEEELLRHPDEPQLAATAEKLAWVYIERGLHQEAFDAAMKAVSLDSVTASYRATLAEVHMMNNAWDAAIGAWNAAIEIDPSEPLLYLRLGDALWEAGRREESREAYAHAIELDSSIASNIDPSRLE